MPIPKPYTVLVSGGAQRFNDELCWQDGRRAQFETVAEAKAYADELLRLNPSYTYTVGLVTPVVDEAAALFT